MNGNGISIRARKPSPKRENNAAVQHFSPCTALMIALMIGADPATVNISVA